MQEPKVTPRDRINGMKVLLGGDAPAPVNYPETDRIPETHVMSSKEIAELTGKPHKHVIRDIRVMVEDLQKDGPNLGHQYNQGLTDVRDNRGYTIEFLMARPMVELLITGYSTIHRAKALARLRELEAIVDERAPVAATPRELTRREILTMALEAEDRADRAEAKIAADAPKVAFAEDVGSGENTFSMSETAKLIKFDGGRDKLIEQLRKDKYLMPVQRDGNGRARGGVEPYQKYAGVDSGLFTTKAKKVEHNNPDNNEMVTVTRVTEKGLKYLHAKYGAGSRHQPQMSLLH